MDCEIKNDSTQVYLSSDSSVSKKVYYLCKRSSAFGPPQMPLIEAPTDLLKYIGCISNFANTSIINSSHPIFCQSTYFPSKDPLSPFPPLFLSPSIPFFIYFQNIQQYEYLYFSFVSRLLPSLNRSTLFIFSPPIPQCFYACLGLTLQQKKFQVLFQFCVT